MQTTTETSGQTYEQMREEIERLQTELQHAKEAARAAKPKAAERTPKPCACGCGQTTLRTFAPGHDQRYRGMLLKAIDEGGPDGQAALETLLTRYPALLHGVSPDTIRMRLGSAARTRADKEARKVAAAQEKMARLQKQLAEAKK